MKLACFRLRTDRRLLQTGKIDKLIVSQGKNGYVSLEKVGGHGRPPPPSTTYESVL